jgi:hypothetical protein
LKRKADRNDDVDRKKKAFQQTMGKTVPFGGWVIVKWMKGDKTVA